MLCVLSCVSCLCPSCVCGALPFAHVINIDRNSLGCQQPAEPKRLGKKLSLLRKSDGGIWLSGVVTKLTKKFCIEWDFAQKTC